MTQSLPTQLVFDYDLVKEYINVFISEIIDFYLVNSYDCNCFLLIVALWFFGMWIVCAMDEEIKSGSMLGNVLEGYPQNIGSSENFLQQILDNPEIPWDWDQISGRSEITIENISDHPELPWNFTLLSSEPNYITLQDALDNRHLDWNWKLLSGKLVIRDRRKFDDRDEQILKLEKSLHKSEKSRRSLVKMLKKKAGGVMTVTKHPETEKVHIGFGHYRDAIVKDGYVTTHISYDE